MSNQNELS